MLLFAFPCLLYEGLGLVSNTEGIQALLLLFPMLRCISSCYAWRSSYPELGSPGSPEASLHPFASLHPSDAKGCNDATMQKDAKIAKIAKDEGCKDSKPCYLCIISIFARIASLLSSGVAALGEPKPELLA